MDNDDAEPQKAEPTHYRVTNPRISWPPNRSAVEGEIVPRERFQREALRVFLRDGCVEPAAAPRGGD